MPVIVLQLLKNHVIGRLKNRDKLGRRILFLNTSELNKFKSYRTVQENVSIEIFWGEIF